MIVEKDIFLYAFRSNLVRIRHTFSGRNRLFPCHCPSSRSDRRSIHLSIYLSVYRHANHHHHRRRQSSVETPNVGHLPYKKRSNNLLCFRYDAAALCWL